MYINLFKVVDNKVQLLKIIDDRLKYSRFLDYSGFLDYSRQKLKVSFHLEWSAWTQSGNQPENSRNLEKVQKNRTFTFPVVAWWMRVYVVSILSYINEMFIIDNYPNDRNHNRFKLCLLNIYVGKCKVIRNEVNFFAMLTSCSALCKVVPAAC
jgi:hypothetical protein